MCQSECEMWTPATVANANIAVGDLGATSRLTTAPAEPESGACYRSAFVALATLAIVFVFFRQSTEGGVTVASEALTPRSSTCLDRHVPCALHHGGDDSAAIMASMKLIVQPRDGSKPLVDAIDSAK